MNSKMIDIVMYVVSISEAGYTFAKGQYPFDDPDVMPQEVSAITWCQIAAFIKIKDVTIEQAHQMFLELMECGGWTYGPEINYKTRQHPDMVPFEQISKDTFAHYTLLGDVVISAKEFARTMCLLESKANYVSFDESFCHQTH